jgi:hypothetical protein
MSTLDEGLTVGLVSNDSLDDAIRVAAVADMLNVSDTDPAPAVLKYHGRELAHLSSTLGEERDPGTLGTWIAVSPSEKHAAIPAVAACCQIQTPTTQTTSTN